MKNNYIPEKYGKKIWSRRTEKNLDLIAKSNFPYTIGNNGEVLLFRFDSLKVDFYPSTGNWKERGNKKLSGGASRFLNWLKRTLEQNFGAGYKIRFMNIDSSIMRLSKRRNR